jgi:hypothetical protein
MERGLLSSIVSSSRIALFEFSIYIDNLEMDLLQNFRSYLSLLNFAFMFAAEFPLWVGFDQLFVTTL